MSSCSRPRTLLALALLAGTAAPLMAASHSIAVRGTGEGSVLTLDGRQIYSTGGAIAGQRLFTFRNSPTVLVVWQEYIGRKAVTKFALGLDGRTVTQIGTTDNLVRLRYATFDPAAGEPPVAPELRARDTNELFLVQFVATPLEEMREEIRALGGTVLRFMTDNTHVIRIPAASRDAVAALPYIRWMGAYHPAYRLDETVRAQVLAGGRMAAARYSIECTRFGMHEQQRLADLLTRQGGLLEQFTPDQYRMEATLTREQMLEVLNQNEVNFLEPWQGPGGIDMNLIRQMGGAVPLLSGAGFLGQGVRGEIFDTGVINAHQQWNGQAPLIHQATASDSHGNACYGIHFATGTGNATATGLLPQREQGIFCVYSANSQFGTGPSRLTLNTQATDPAGQFRSSYQTSSVGHPQVTNYTTVSAEVDDYLFRVDYLSFQSQSNTGNRNSRPQAWAKNIVSVGGMDLNETLARTDDVWASGASIGPAADLRVKPDLAHSFGDIFTTYATSATGYGQFGGTSGATPITAGHAGLLMQMWHQGVFQGFGGASSVFLSRPKSTTAKALLINGAYRYTPSSGNRMYRGNVGWGMADLTKLYNDRTKFYIVNANDPVTNGQTRVHQLAVLAGEPELRATLVYPDPAGSPSAAQNRVNDLSLKVTAPNGTIYWGNNGLVPSATSGSGQQAGANWSTTGGNPNSYDPVENVFVQNPAPGNWTVEVVGSQIVQDGYLATPGVDAVYSLVVSNVSTLPLSLDLLTTPRAVMTPGQQVVMDVKILPGSQTYVSGSGELRYRVGSSGGFTAVPLVAQGANIYRGTLPTAACGDTLQYYVAASGSGGAVVTLPANAPATTYSTTYANIELGTLLQQSFTSGLPAGWSVTGLWNIGSNCPPPGNVCDGPTWAYFGQPSSCNYQTAAAVTGALTLPQLQLLDFPGIPTTLSFCFAKETENNELYDRGEVRVNGSAIDLSPESSSFTTRDVDLSSYAGQTVTIAFVFDSSDEVSNEFRGWHVDNIRLTGPVNAGCVAACYANCDASTAQPILNVGDFTCFLQRFAAGESYANCDASTSAPVLNVGDFTCFLQRFAQGCP
jgi:serine protease AprX